ncbi:hypothetical protein [Facklamia miroungae]|uniref:Uncharacterized protein n=1 Tax=Facklamia miroungae TaxID=120956 RepID=A0A1G7TLR6_9LACT|nr:hypothetical protein [Facklamia miroungae]NKZ29781.1 hypothetical protein [Facklamia miroungae]SDG36273.1 hypothetical protein SAMN05421791_10673 [Facklamia miroungae]
MRNEFDSTNFKKEQRFILLVLAIALIIQIIVAGLYFFVEKQTVLLFPMFLGILASFTGIGRLSQLNN